jgi:hypothetical protein
MFAEFVGTQLRLLRLVLDGLFAVGSLWSLLRTTSKHFLYFLSIFVYSYHALDGFLLRKVSFAALFLNMTHVILYL